MKAKKCILKMNSYLTGHEYKEIQCESISEALRIAKSTNYPYRIYVGKKLVKKGWFASKH